MSSTSGYGYPPFPSNFPQGDPAFTNAQAPPQDWYEDTGEFSIRQTIPRWTEAGATDRMVIYFTHDKDGAIQPTGVVIAFLDGNGNAVASGASGITVGAVTQDPSGSNKYYSSCQFGASLQPGDYVVQWTGTYTPLGASVALNIRSRQRLEVKATQAPSKYYFFDTAKA